MKIYTQFTNREKLQWITNLIEERKVNIAESYKDWLLVGFCSASFGEFGREYFHRISRISTKYKREENERQFNFCLKSVKDFENVGLLFKLAKREGLIVSPFYYVGFRDR